MPPCTIMKSSGWRPLPGTRRRTAEAQDTPDRGNRGGKHFLHGLPVFGIETGENSFGYVASYCKDRELSELRACLNTINKAAGGMIAGIEKHFAEVCKEQGIDLSEQKKEPEQTPPAVEEPAAEEPAAPELDPIDRLAADIGPVCL